MFQVTAIIQHSLDLVSVMADIVNGDVKDVSDDNRLLPMSAGDLPSFQSQLFLVFMFGGLSWSWKDYIFDDQLSHMSAYTTSVWATPIITCMMTLHFDLKMCGSGIFL